MKPKALNIFSWIERLWIRIDPPPISSPFITISYERAWALWGSVSNNLIPSSSGIVNGWWAAIQRPKPSSYSNNGQSTTHTKSKTPSGIIPVSWANSRRRWSSESVTTFHLSATITINSPPSRSNSFFKASLFSSVKKRAIGPENSPSSYLTQAKPLAL